MSTNRTLRTPLTVGMLAVTAAFGLSACVPTEEPAVEETEATQPAETETEQSAETERPSEESSDSGQDSSEAPSEDADDSAADDDAPHPVRCRPGGRGGERQHLCSAVPPGKKRPGGPAVAGKLYELDWKVSGQALNSALG